MTPAKPNTLVTETSADLAAKQTDFATVHRSLYALKAFKANEVIIGFSFKKVHNEPSYLTVQISEHEHIELFPEYLECINHSCDPNCFFDTTKRELVALKPIQKSEELTFFYPSAEWDMDQSFPCRCGSHNCIGLIRGAKYLDDSIVKTYRFTDFIKGKLAAR